MGYTGGHPTLRSVVTANLDSTQTISPCSFNTNRCTVPLFPSATKRFPAESTTMCRGCCNPEARRLILYPVPILGEYRLFTPEQDWASAPETKRDTRAVIPITEENGAIVKENSGVRTCKFEKSSCPASRYVQANKPRWISWEISWEYAQHLGRLPCS